MGKSRVETGARAFGRHRANRLKERLSFHDRVAAARAEDRVSMSAKALSFTPPSLDSK